MGHFEGSSIKLILWSLVLQTFMASALHKATANNSQKIFARTPVTASSLYEQYTLGQVEDGAKIIYTYQFTQTFDEVQQEISLDFHYPDLTDAELNENGLAEQSSTIITQIQLFVKAQDGSSTQAYILQGGIREDNISLQIVASNTNLLNYMLVIYGKAQ